MQVPKARAIVNQFTNPKGAAMKFGKLPLAIQILSLVIATWLAVQVASGIFLILMLVQN